MPDAPRQMLFDLPDAPKPRRPLPGARAVFSPPPPAPTIAEELAEKAKLEQLPLDLENGNQDGLKNLAEALNYRRRQINQAYKIRLGQTMRLKLKTLETELVGELVLVADPVTLNPKEPLPLRIGHIQFYHSEIEAWSLIT